MIRGNDGCPNCATDRRNRQTFGQNFLRETDKMFGIFQSRIEVGDAIEETRFSNDAGEGFVSEGEPAEGWGTSYFQRDRIGLEENAEDLRALVIVSGDNQGGESVIGKSGKNLKAALPNGDSALFGREGLERGGVFLKEFGQFTTIPGVAAAQAGGVIGERKDFLNVVREDVLSREEARIGNEQETLWSVNE